MKKIKVFHILPDLGTGGAEKLALDICTFLNKDEFDTTLISLYPSKNSIYEQIADENDLNIIFLNKHKGLDYKILINLNKLFREQKPDIVHTHLYVAPYVLPAMIINNINGRVHTVHNIASMELGNFKKKIMKIAYQFFKVTPVAISDYIKKTIEIEYHINTNKIPCIYNGIDTNKFTRSSRKNEKVTTFVHVGRFSKQKNHKLLIESFALSLTKNPNMVLKLIGDGPLKQEIINMIAALGVEDKVILKGIQKDVRFELNSSDAFILSSDWEGLPISVLEAMSCGLPIISTKSGGTPDIVKDGENGILVNLGDKEGLAKAINELSSDYQLRKKMGDNSYIYSKQYDIQQVCEQYSLLYKGILGQD
ncbi:glycosyltransferase [Peribacillus sp. FSL R5-0717]|uniref:glycosyltransferase n=1 Tax=Peribacillus sp. FSL R5-0717 TaxID=2975308 RepID=UPI0030F6DA74